MNSSSSPAGGEWPQELLADLTARGQWRELRPRQGGPGARTELNGRTVLNFASNDYLGLAGHPRLTAAAGQALAQWGWGSAASALVSGWTEEHAALVRELAEFEGTADAVLFPTGYQANLGTIGALVGAADTILLDKLCHASLIDGARLSGAQMRVFPHRDLRKLARLLGEARAGRTLVLTESVFSMDGDTAPLAELRELCTRAGALLLVDEAHATGLLGAGRGLFQPERPGEIKLGTLSKALGGLGGFATGDRAVCALLRNRARALIYTTAAPAAAAAAAREALQLVKAEPWRRESALANAERLRGELRAGGVDVPDGAAAIVPLVVGDEAQTLDLARSLLAEGFFVPAIRPPTVPRGTSRLRFSVSAEHTPEEVTRAGRRAAELWRAIVKDQSAALDADGTGR